MPRCRINVLGAAGDELRDEVEDNHQAGLGVGKGKRYVDEVGEEDDVVEDNGADVGQRHVDHEVSGKGLAERSGPAANRGLQGGR